jgi:HSP20 family protein
MDKVSRIHLRMLQGRLGDVVYELTKAQFTQFCPGETWQPAINAYRFRNQIVICVELAGVDRSSLELTVEPRRLRLRGSREAPEPASQEPDLMQILAMEIDYGPFERQVELPNPVDPERVKAEQRNGLLWIYLPLRSMS